MGQVRIVWNGQGVELDSVTVDDDGDRSVADALIKLIAGAIVAAGDSFTISRL